MRVPYSPLLSLTESHVATYKLYVLKHPVTNEVFYVGQTVQDLEARLNGHINENDLKKEKCVFIKEIIDSGQRPIISEIETIHGTCYIDQYLVNEREYYWIKYYKSIGCKLLNIMGMSPSARSGEYHGYLSSIKKGETSWHYYYCGKTYGGHEVYDEKKLTADGFKFTQEDTYSFYNPSSKGYDPWQNPRFKQKVGRNSPFDEHEHDFKAYKDLDPDYYDDDY